MTLSLEKELITQTIKFHGHGCPGLSIGIRVSELAREKLDIQNLNNPLCVVETDMCGVDAIQYLTGCTLGKGNLILRDYGKSAFTFYDRDTQKGFRAVFKNIFSENEENRDKRSRQILQADLKDLFSIKPVSTAPAKPARILKSIHCDSCDEMVMESRIRLLDNRKFCIPCFQMVEQKT